MPKSLKILVLMSLIISGCGGGTSTDEAEIVNAPAVIGSTFSGLAFGAINRDRNIRTSRIYYYDFSTGRISQTLSGESGSPGVFFKDNRLFVLNRDNGNQNLKVIDDVKSTPVVPTAIDFQGLTAGDPWSLESVTSGKTILISSPETGKLSLVDYVSGEVTDVDTASLNNQPLRVTALQRSGAVINAVHSGVKRLAADSYTADNTQAVYRIKIDASGALSFTDENTGDVEIDGKALTATNPVLAGINGSAMTLIGLCNNVISGCKSAIETYNNGAVTTVNTFTSNTFKYQLVNQIIQGPSASEVFAHVQTAANDYKIILINTVNLQVKDIHTFSDYNLYGFNYDQGSKTLFVGESGDQSGTLFIYKDQVLTGEVEISGVLSSSTFVP
jgi:hypothetical protein